MVGNSRNDERRVTPNVESGRSPAGGAAAAVTRRRVVVGAAATFAVAAMLPPRPARAGDAAPFALLSSDAAERLKTILPASPMAAYAIRSGKRWADRNPQPLAKVHTEGTLPHQGIYDVSLEAMRDWQAAGELALAARLSGEAKLAEKAAALVAAWLKTYQPAYDPIDETNLLGLFLAVDLLPDAARAGLAEGFRAFARTLSSGYLDRMPGLKGGTATNNWQSHRVKLATLGAYASGDAGLVARAKAAFAKQLGDNLKADGSVLDFAERDALHYVTYDLEPLLVAALAAKVHGEDWYGLKTAGKAGLKEALRWLAPYADGTKTHEEFVHSTVEFDRTRAKAGLPGFAGQWDPAGAEETFALAARLDGDFAPLAAKLTPGFTGAARPHLPWLRLVLPG